MQRHWRKSSSVLIPGDVQRIHGQTIMVNKSNRTKENLEMWNLPSLLEEELPQCEVCHGWLPSRESCEHHQKSCKEKRFKCVESDKTGCSKTFADIRDAQEHPGKGECPRVTHEGGDSINCYICRRSFTRRDNYGSHFTMRECKGLLELYLWGLAYNSDKFFDSSK